MRIGGWRSWATVLIAVAVLAVPLQATAEVDDGAIVADGFSFSKLFDLTECAVGIALIGSGTGLLLAGLACGKAAATWWTT